MGSGMARRLLQAGFPLTVYNRNPAPAAALGSAGAQIAPTPRHAASQASVVLAMVADDAASRAVWLGDSGALAGATRGALLIESSTVTPAWIRELHEAASKQGCELVDAPVTGSKKQASEGALNFLVGGRAEAVESARPILAAMGRSITHVGPAGSGALLKLLNNFLCGVQAASFAEALALIERSSLDRDKAIDILANGTPGSLLIRTVLPRMLARDYAPNFLLSLMAKDLHYALREGEELGRRPATAAAALEIFQTAITAGFGAQDFSAIAESARRRKTDIPSGPGKSTDT